MNITPHLFDAFLKCPTKCYLRALGEVGSGNEYADRVKTQDEAYRAAETEWRLAEIPADKVCTLATGRNAEDCQVAMRLRSRREG